MWKPRKNGSATMVSMTSNKTSLEAAAVDAGTTKRAEAGRTVMDGVTRSCDLAPATWPHDGARTTRGGKDGTSNRLRLD